MKDNRKKLQKKSFEEFINPIKRLFEVWLDSYGQQKQAKIFVDCDIKMVFK